MLHIRGGFFTSYAADLIVPAWLYAALRGLHSSRGRTKFLQRTLGRSPELAAVSLFIASALTEVSQVFWPDGLFSGRFDPLDLLMYASGLAVVYTADKVADPQRYFGKGAVSK
jgi:hypothetical protein